jgi:NitT/TauT family transport system permease protein
VKRLRSIIPALIPLVVVTATAELAVRYGLVKSYLVPAPSSVLRAMIESHAELFGALLTTSLSALVGFVLSTVAGIAIAVFLSSSRAIQRAFYPYAVFFQTVPIIAIVPWWPRRLWCRFSR